MPSKRKREPRAKREFWGVWEDKTHVLVHHPAHIRGEKVMDEAYRNLIYAVQVSHEPSEWGTVKHLWVRRHDGKALTWREMQRIKNQLAGPSRIGIEVYPAQGDVVDQANMYHLWVLPEGFKLPFSLKEQQS